jgi:hypothetical protein
LNEDPFPVVGTVPLKRRFGSVEVNSVPSPTPVKEVLVV